MCNMLRMYIRAIRGVFQHTIRRGPKHVAINSHKYSTGSEDIKTVPWEKAMPYKSIPGPKPLPLIGNIWLSLPIIGEFYKSTPLNTLKLSWLSFRLHKKYGKIFRIESLSEPDTVCVANPDDMEMVFRNEGIYPIRESASRTLGYYRNNIRQDVFQGVASMLTVHGKEWQDIRSKVNPILMQSQAMVQYTKGIDLVTNAFLERIRQFAKLHQNKEMPADFLNTIYSWTLESVAYIALNKRLGCLDSHLDKNSEPLKIIKSALKAFELYEYLEFQPTHLNIYKTKKWKRFVEMSDFLTFTYLKYIKEAESQIEAADEKSMSVLQKLLQIDRRVAIATTMDMLFAGIDTTGKQTASILYFLAINQNKQDILRNELVNLMPNKETPVTKDILEKSSYLKGVIKETLRMAPIAGGNIKQSVKDMVLSGYQIPKGTNIIVCNALASKLEENYPRSSEFLPERWLRTTVGELSHKNTNRFATLPFGFGPRSCAGQRIATLEMEIGIAKIIRNFQVMWHHKEPTFDGAPFVGIVDPLKFQFNEIED